MCVVVTFETKPVCQRKREKAQNKELSVGMHIKSCNILYMYKKHALADPLAFVSFAPHGLRHVAHTFIMCAQIAT